MTAMDTYRGPRTFFSVTAGMNSSMSRSTISSPTHILTDVSLFTTAGGPTVPDGHLRLEPLSRPDQPSLVPLTGATLTYR